MYKTGILLTLTIEPQRSPALRFTAGPGFLLLYRFILTKNLDFVLREMRRYEKEDFYIDRAAYKENLQEEHNAKNKPEPEFGILS